jgi:UDP-N-acetylmuramoylalanine--D-glutamate ligase
VQPTILLVGGYERGISMIPLIDEIFKDRVKHVITIGQTGDKIAKQLIDRGFEHVTRGVKSMSEAVMAAKETAVAGDAVLLSAAAASFDMFPNFEVRGNEFKKAVNSL